MGLGADRPGHARPRADRRVRDAAFGVHVPRAGVSELEGRRAFVTGGSSGIGAATVAALREAGARVVAPARADCDVRNAASVGWAVSAAADELGGLDLVVPAAGLGRFAPTAEVALDAVGEIMAVT